MNVPFNGTTDDADIPSSVGMGIVITCIVLGSVLIVAGVGIAVWAILKKRAEKGAYTQLQVLTSGNALERMAY